MNFLSPWFLLGAAAIAGPVLFHLIRRVVKERMPFSSLMFLNPTPPRVTRRRKLDDRLLLLLRCLCVLLLAAGFSRPFFAKDEILPAVADGERQTVLLVDTSASMRRSDLWAKARAIAEKYLARATPGDQVAVVAFDSQPHTLVSFAEWSNWTADQRAELAQKRLDAISPGWMGTHLGPALTGSAELFREDAGKSAGARDLVLITDLQEGSKLDGLQGHEWPAGVKVTVERVEAGAQSNAGLEILNNRDAAGDVHVRIANARDANREKFQLNWEGQNGAGPVGEPVEIYLPPGRVGSFSAPKLPSGTKAATLKLSGDETDFDNRSFYSAPESEHVTIAWSGPESANDPAHLRYYLQRVFAETPRRKVEINPSPDQVVFTSGRLNQAALAVIDSRLADDEVTVVREWLSKGKTALMVLTDAEAGPMLAALAGEPGMQVTEAAGDFVLLGEMDFSHPLFVPFADPRFSDFSHIHFWKHRRLEIPTRAKARVVAKFDDGSPALVQFTVGTGNLLVLTSGWNPADSQLAVSSKFPPLMETLLDWSGSAAQWQSQFLTGDALPSVTGTGEAAANVEWQKPDGKKEGLAAGVPFTGADLPGIYTATLGGKERRFAVNLPLDESRTAPMSSDELVRLGVPMQTTVAVPLARVQERQRHLQQAELENRQKLWRCLIIAVLVVIFGEIVLGGWLARRVKITEASA